MRLLFLGTCTFGDASSSIVRNPFTSIAECFSIGDIIFLNMNGIISHRKSRGKFISDGSQLLSLKKIVPQIPIVVTFKNDKLTLCDEGVKDTERFLSKHGFVFSTSSLKPILYGNLCIFDFTSMDLMKNPDAVKHTIPLHITTRLDGLLLEIIKSYVKPMRKIVIIVKTDTGSIVKHMLFKCISERMIECGAAVVFGYGNHNLVGVNNYKKYKNGLIIASLGDLVNCNLDSSKHYGSTTEICRYNTLSTDVDVLKINRVIVEDCLLPSI